MRKVTALLCLGLSACFFTLDENGDGPPPGSPYCGDGVLNGTEQCDDGNSTAGDGCTLCTRDGGGATGHVTANWTFKNIVTGTTTGCPSGFDTVALYSQEIDSIGTPIGTPIIDLFDCAVGTGTSAPLPATMLRTKLHVTDTSGSSVYAMSVHADLDLSISDRSFSAQILNDGGYFYVGWALVGATSGDPLTCAQAGVARVESVATDVASSANTASDSFDCMDQSGFTAGFQAATYSVSVTAYNASDQPVASAPSLPNQVIATRNAVTNLGTQVIQVPGL